MERTLSNDTEESFKSMPGSMRNSLRHIDLISTSIHLGSLDEIASTRRTAIDDRNLSFMGRHRNLHCHSTREITTDRRLEAENTQ